MFGYNYRIVPVNTSKGVYKIKPTSGTYVKAFALPVVIWAGLVFIGTVAQKRDEKEAEIENLENTFNLN